MTNTHSNLLIKIITLLTLTFGLVYASNMMKPNKKITEISYANMTTMELQAEVEKRSTEGTLPFEMGMELIKRWQTKEDTTY